MKTLIVRYLPSGENSNTKKLYEHLKSRIDMNNAEEIDLLKDKVPFFKEDSITSYYLRNFMGKELSVSQAQAIQPFDNIGEKVINADRLVFAFPMHNFSLPGIVKSFFDSFIFRGEYFEIQDPKKKEKVQNKKIIVLYSHAGKYPVGTELEKYDFVRSLLTQLFSFMGIKDYSFVSYCTSDVSKNEEFLAEAKNKIEKLV